MNTKNEIQPRGATEIQHELLEKYVAKDLLDKFRYDWDVSVFGKKDVKVRKDSYGMALGKRQGEYLSGMNRALNPLNKVRRAWYCSFR